MMTENRRIFINVCATYGRSLYALALGLISARWTLQILGQVDYGLMGVVGGLTAFIVFFNSLIAGAIGRFYAVSVGMSQRSYCQGEGLEECRKWFNVALVIHTLLPLILVSIGYPLGVWAIENWMTIPLGRIQACKWVFRYVCVSCLIGMFNIPFSAMYGAKQYIAELTVYSFISTTVNFCALLYMVNHPGDWLATYAFMGMIVNVIPQGIICYRAIRVFPECKVIPRYFWDKIRFRQLCGYVFWQFFGSAGGLLRSQGFSLLINKCFGPVMNAAMAIGNNVASHTDSLSSSLTGAFAPAIMNQAGRGDVKKMLLMACRSSKFGVVLCSIFLLPLLCEIESILVLWLKHPPAMTGLACICMLIIMMLDQYARGLNIAINADGRIGLYNAVIGSMHICSLPIAMIVVCVFDCGFVAVLTVLVTAKLLGVILGAAVNRFVIDFPVGFWFREVCLTTLTAMTSACGCGMLIRHLFRNFYFVRIGMVVSSVEICFLTIVWFVVLSGDEKTFIRQKIATFLKDKKT